MGIKRKLFFFILLIAGFGIFLSGCSTITGLFSKKQTPSSPEGAYNNGLLLMNKKKYEAAAKEFRIFKEQYPLSDLVPLAELRLADSLFFDKKYLEAFFQYEEFKKLHPIHAESPYATYQMAMCYFKQMLGVDRDQAQTYKSIELFRVVTENYPQSPYAEQARGKIAICQRQLAEHEFYIGNFYLRNKRYRAALARFEGILQKYPNSGLEAKLEKLINQCRAEILKKEKNRKALRDPAHEEKRTEERAPISREANLFRKLNSWHHADEHPARRFFGQFLLGRENRDYINS